MIKILVFLFIFSIFDILRESYLLIRDIRMNTNYKINKVRLIGIGIALSYILTMLIMGF